MQKTVQIVSILMIVFIISITGQTLQKNEIKSSADYYWAEASAINIAEASDAALKELLRKISADFKSEYTSKVSEDTGVGFEEKVEAIFQTYASSTLKNVITLKEQAGNQFSVLHYLAKSDIDKIFNDRKELVYNIFEKGMKFEENLNYGYALKDYYFAIVLMNSIPGNDLKYNEFNLLTEVPARITSLLNSIEFTLTSDVKLSGKERELILEIKNENNPIVLLDFSFWDGENQIEVRALDGEGVFRLNGPGVDLEELELNITYNYYENREDIEEVAELWEVVNKPIFNNSKLLQLKKYDKRAEVDNKAKMDTGKNYKINFVENDSCDVIESIGKETLTFIELIEEGDLEKIQNQYKHDPYLLKKIGDFLSYNYPKIINREIDAHINKTFDGWELRKLPMITRYSSINKQSKEYIIFDFSKDGKLNDLNFGIMDNLYNEFVRDGLYGKDWERRQVIIKFIERYRTTFLTRDIKMLDTLFSDEAIIIVGRVLKKNDIKDVYTYAKINDSQPDVEYLRYSKDEYIERQRELFRLKKDLFLGYSNFKITRKNKQPGVYGISLRQDYKSTGYSDEGYLFLLVDFLEELPQIYVRSWQPKEWDERSLIKLSNFNINR